MKKLHILFLSILPALVILFCFLGFLAAPNDPEEVVITQSFLAGAFSPASCMAVILRWASC